MWLVLRQKILFQAVCSFLRLYQATIQNCFPSLLSTIRFKITDKGKRVESSTWIVTVDSGARCLGLVPAFAAYWSYVFGQVTEAPCGSGSSALK